MGSIRNLEDGNTNVHLLLTSSNLSELYVYDILKKKCKANRESIYDVNSRGSANEMLELINLQTFMADKWLFVIDFSKVKSILKEKLGLFDVDSAEFLIKVKNYKEFKEMKAMLMKVNDIYLSYIRKYDVEFLLKEYELPSALVEFIARSYASSPEQVFILLKELETGRKLEKRKDIVQICGIAPGSLNHYAMSLLKDKPKTPKGLKKSVSNRIGVGSELADSYGYSKMRNFLLSSVKDILDVKELYMLGVIYDRISDLPDSYDKVKLSKLNNYLPIIKEIPYSRILKLYLMLKKQGRWFSDMDLANFIYQYYGEGEY